LSSLVVLQLIAGGPEAVLRGGSHGTPASNLTALKQIVYTIMVDFDPAKEAINLSKHHVSLARWVDLDIKTTFVDDRYDYGEIRNRAYGFIDGLTYCLTFTERNGKVRPISLRAYTQRR
jgi:hypothetical protein